MQMDHTIFIKALKMIRIPLKELLGLKRANFCDYQTACGLSHGVFISLFVSSEILKRIK